MNIPQANIQELNNLNALIRYIKEEYPGKKLFIKDRDSEYGWSIKALQKFSPKILQITEFNYMIPTTTIPMQCKNLFMEMHGFSFNHCSVLIKEFSEVEVFVDLFCNGKNVNIMDSNLNNTITEVYDLLTKSQFNLIE